MDSFKAAMKAGLARPVLPAVLGLGGSPRQDGNSDILLQHILQGAERERVDNASFNLRDIAFGGCIGCERCRADKICTGLMDGMSSLYPFIVSARGLVLVCPTHNYNITCWMKAFIDRLYCFYTFDNERPRGWSSRLSGQGRKAVLGVVFEQEDEADMGFTLEAMRRPLEALGYAIVDELVVGAIFDRGRIRRHSDILAEAEDLGARLAQAVR